MSKSRANILVVDDDPMVRSTLRRCLESGGYHVLEAEDQAGSLEKLSSNVIDLVTLDLRLGHDDGLGVAKEIRAISDVPIVIVSGEGDVIDRIVGLEVGADDYITKPFHVREVLARVRSILRRAAGVVAVPAESSVVATTGIKLSFDGMTAHPDSFELQDRSGQIVEMTTGDFRLLVTFLTYPHRILSRDRLMDLMHGTEWSPVDRTIDNQIARIRKKIERDPQNPVLIKTVRGLGYILTTNVNTSN